MVIKLDLKVAAEEFEMIDSDMHLFYNIETGKFDFYTDFMLADLSDEMNVEKFEDDEWIAAPSQWDINKYDIMAEFAETVSDPHKNEMLSIALEGRGAFRRFKNMLCRLDLEDKWYNFKREAHVEIAREWCEENDIPYIDEEPKLNQHGPADNQNPLDVAVIPLTYNAAEYAVEILCASLNYAKSTAEAEVRCMLNRNRIALAAFTGRAIVGIIGAISQYGVTGWELHPLAVLKEYRGRGIGRLLVETLESEAVMRGGVMIYLGSDDESGVTSLYGTDLYEDTFDKLKNIKNLNGHPFPFYEKMGYKIVGVLPEANGVGKPDIWIAKRIKKTAEKKVK